MNPVKTNAALRLVLLFHGGGLWDEWKKMEWANLLTVCLGPAGTRRHPAQPTNEATTKNLCDAVRAALEDK